jgi:hypothetical protein
MSATTKEERERLLDATLGEMERLVARTVECCDAGEEWPERVRHGLECLLGELAARPQRAEEIARALPALDDPDAYARYVALFETLALYLKEGRDYSERGDELPDEVEMLALGSVEAIVCDEISRGHAKNLPQLMPAILFSVLVPFLGPVGASEAMRSAAQAA